jgi:ribosomal peptide maturation radical SAM protein 1
MEGAPCGWSGLFHSWPRRTTRGRRGAGVPHSGGMTSPLPLVQPRSDPLDLLRGPGRRVLLVCPPFQHARLASLSTALLAAVLRERDVVCAEAYVHFDLVRQLGREIYERITDRSDGLTGELLFAEGVHGSIAEAEAERKLEALFGDDQQRRAVRDRLAARCLAQVELHRPEIVGLTTSLNQLVPALWIAQLLKRAHPHLIIVLGGSACAEPMGPQIAAGYPFVDYVVSGYGERPLLTLAAGDLPRERVLRSHHRVDLDRLPFVDYTAFLDQAGEFAEGQLNLTFESSRGCWWGEKNHCTFCGLNNLEMAFNEKSSERVVSEIRALWDRYGRNLFATDTILSRRHLKEAIPRLAEYETKPILFYETKANATEAEVVALRRANVVAIQPGIESLSSHLLQLLKKGITTIRNLAYLKWCRERDLAVVWNQLCGIPGELHEDYDEQITLMEHIPHLQPPGSAHLVRIDRFSPYFEDFAQHGYEAIEPFAEYRLLHPHFDDAAVRDVAYHFTGIGAVQPDAYLDRFSAAVERWKERHARGEGLFLDPQQGLVRNGADRGLRIKLNPVLERLIEATHTVAPVQRVLGQTGLRRADLESVARQGLLYIERDKVINLIVRLGLPR